MEDLVALNCITCVGNNISAGVSMGYNTLDTNHRTPLVGFETLWAVQQTITTPVPDGSRMEENIMTVTRICSPYHDKGACLNYLSLRSFVDTFFPSISEPYVFMYVGGISFSFSLGITC